MKKILSIIMLMVSFAGTSQQLQQSSLYMYNALYYNPGYAGTRNTLSASLVARKQWVGFDGAPTSEFVSVHSPIANKRMGIGMHVNYDVIGSRKKFTAYADLSGSIKLNSKGDRLNIGISAGVDNYQFGFASLYALDPNDAIAMSSYSVMKPNVGAGIYYYGEKHYVGISVPNIIETEGDFQGIVSNVNRRHYLLTAGRVFGLNSVWDFKPSTIVKYLPGAPLTFDLNASFFAYKKIWAGVMYRHDEGVGVNVAYVINKMFTVGYAYDYPINALRTNQMGSHEIMLQFDFSKYKGSGQLFSPRYF